MRVKNLSEVFAFDRGHIGNIREFPDKHLII
jgi:hypothetical protein